MLPFDRWVDSDGSCLLSRWETLRVLPLVSSLLTWIHLCKLHTVWCLVDKSLLAEIIGAAVALHCFAWAGSECSSLQ